MSTTVMPEGEATRGDAYTVVLGDCLDVLAQYPDNSFDALITDPPFALAGGISNGLSSHVDGQYFLFWWRAICAQLARVLKPQGEGFIWCDWRSAALIAEGFQAKTQTYDVWRVSQIVHHYREMPGQGNPFRNSVDMIAYVRGPKSSGARILKTTHNFVSKYWYYGKHDHHPAEKDPEICMQLLQWCSDEGALVLDPFMGGGSTAIACARTGRGFFGIERDDLFYQTAEQRIRKAYACYTPAKPFVRPPIQGQLALGAVSTVGAI